MLTNAAFIFLHLHTMSFSFLCFLVTASFNELLYLVLAIGGGIAAVVFCLIVIVSCRRCKRKHRQRQLEGDEEVPRKERKDPTVW